jgi:hypothetical protein
LRNNEDRCGHLVSKDGFETSLPSREKVSSELEKTLIGALITELNSLFNLGLGMGTSMTG